MTDLAKKRSWTSLNLNDDISLDETIAVRSVASAAQFGLDDDGSINSFSSYASARSASSLGPGVDRRRGSDRRRRTIAQRQRGRGCIIDGLGNVTSRSSDDLVSLGSYRLEPTSAAGMRRSSAGAKPKRGGSNNRPITNSLRYAGADLRCPTARWSIVPGFLLIVALLGIAAGFFCFLTSLVTQDMGNLKGSSQRKWDRSYILDERRIIKMIKRTVGSYKGRQWPISVRDEEKDFEVIPHPAAVNEDDGPVQLLVPRFYFSDDDDQYLSGGTSKRPLGDGRLLTRRVVNMIGSHNTEEGRKKDDTDTRTIYVSIASYRDWRCRESVESIFSRAKYPDRIRVGEASGGVELHSLQIMKITTTFIGLFPQNHPFSGESFFPF